MQKESFEKDRPILRELATRIAEIAALPIQQEKKRLWRKLNGLKPERPMVAIDQICWGEFQGDALKLRCETDDCRVYERFFRRTLYQWEHFPVDMVVEPFVRVPMAITNTSFGLGTQEETLAVQGIDEVVSHKYANQFTTMDDLEKIKTPIVTHDATETDRRLGLASWLFGDIIAPRKEGVDPYLSLWDLISHWMGVEGVLYAMIDQPELLHAMAKRVADGYLAALDQLENLGALCYGQSLIHCTGAYTDDLPSPSFDPNKPKTQDIWMFGLAQMFSTISPAAFDEYEIAYSMPIFERFGLVYYGCCDPLDAKMNQVRKIPHLRKISMSPWANQERGAVEIGPDYVFSRKPNPAFLAMGSLDEDLVRNDLISTRNVCRKNECPVEFILKDISTLCGRPERLSRWADIAMKVVKE